MTKEDRLRELRKTVAGVTAMNPHRAKPLRDPAFDLEVCKRITDVYMEHINSDPALRELAVQKIIIPERLDPVRDGDLFAGRFSDGILGYIPEIWGGYEGYYLLEGPLDGLLLSGKVSPEEKSEWEKLRVFWRTHATHNKAYREAWRVLSESIEIPEDADWAGLKEQWQAEDGDSLLAWFLSNATNRVAGPYLDIPLLLELGVDGLLDRIMLMKSRNPDPGRLQYYDCLLELVRFFRDVVIARYEKECVADGLTEMAETLSAIRAKPPRTLRQAMQLAWLYLLVTRALNIGRMDIWFGRFLTRDLEGGLLTQSGAQALVDNMWKLMLEEGHNFNSRVILGGRDRKHPADADRFALLCIEATRKLKATRPQTTLRMYKGMDTAVRDAAFKAIGEGCTFPMLLNDDINIPAVAKAFNIPGEEACRYLPLGCGEFTLESIGICSPNSAFILPKCLEYALHDGCDGLTGHQIGPRTGTPGTFADFESLWHAYDRQVRYFMELTARKHALGNRVVKREAPFLLMSALYSDCLEKGRGLLEGVRYMDGSTEVSGFVNVADSLTALNSLVYRDKRYSIVEVVSAMDANYAGADKILQELRAAPKYGNDMEEADAMAVRVHCHVADVAAGFSGVEGELRRFLITHVNNHAHVQFGAMTAASADGRRHHGTFANANNPSPGADVNGTTAMLKSLSRIPAHNHAGVVQNMKFSRMSFERYPEKTKALMDAYFSFGGTQAMMTVVSRKDMEDAMEHPDRHQNLLVRVGGYSARFVELSRALQLEILSRTLN